jgi:soluble lytic murein transglycosylase-like protein
MTARLIGSITAICATLLAIPAPAHAQIYAWRDAAGHLVMSDRPKDPSARTFAVARTGLRSTRPLVSRKAAAYETLIETHATAQAVSPDLVRAVIQAESAFNPHARSHKGAMGLMQLMPATATEYGVLDAFNPAENIRAGVAYLKQLLVRFSHNVELALAAYNAGPTAVEKYGKVPPYKETRNYVAKIRGATAGTSGSVPPTRIYRRVETVDGRPVVKYSNVRTAGAEIVGSAARR